MAILIGENRADLDRQIEMRAIFPLQGWEGEVSSDPKFGRLKWKFRAETDLGRSDGDTTLRSLIE